MDYPFTAVTGSNSDQNTTSIIEVRVARDENGIDEAALVSAVKTLMAATSGVVEVATVKYSVTQESL